MINVEIHDSHQLHTLKVPGYDKLKRKKVGSKMCGYTPIRRNTLLVSAKGVFCQWVKNGRHTVHQGPYTPRMF
jgi:hypothetical protein